MASLIQRTWTWANSTRWWGTGRSCVLQFMALQRVRHNWMTEQQQQMFLPVVILGSESWTIKKAKHLRIDAFKLWCWKRLLWVPWTARRSNQSILKDINHEYSLKGLMLKLKFQYFGHLCEEPTHWKRVWWWERLRTGGERGNRGWGSWMASLTQWTWVWADSRR